MKKVINNKLAYTILLVIILIIILQTVTICINQNTNIELIPNIMQLTYIENTGGAFGIGGNETIGFIIVSLIVIGLMLRFLIAQRERLDQKTSISLSLMLAGRNK